jgi:hypothetical protein
MFELDELRALAKAALRSFNGARWQREVRVDADDLLAMIAELRDLRAALTVCYLWIGQHRVPGDDDWACVECRPESGSLIDGFRCAYHQAAALLAALDATQEKPEATT